MNVDVAMPRLSDSMTEGAVTTWFKSVGEAVSEGEAIAELETEKSTVDLASPATGVLASIAVEAGSGPVPVGTVLAVIDTEGKGAGSPKAAAAAKAAPATSAEAAKGSKREATAPEADGAAPTAPAAGTRAPATVAAASSPGTTDEASIPATPLARRMAAQAGLRLSALSRSGIGGKVSKADVEAALGKTAVARQVPSPSRPAAASPAAAPVAAGVAEPPSRVRRTIAERMARAKATIPHFYLSVDCRADRLLEVRERLKADGLAVSVNDFVLRAAASALRSVPEANASWTEAGIVRHARVDIAVAVALDEGLVTPVVRGVDTLGLAAIGAAVRDLASRARAGSLAPHEYDGGTFTVSNLGMHGIGEMFAIINPPQACILGVGAAEARPVVDGGTVVAGTVMTLSISADHRVLDGTTGARFLAEVRRLLEEPARMLA